MKDMGLIETLRGPLGGAWLTLNGREFVANHRTPNAINK